MRRLFSYARQAGLAACLSLITLFSAAESAVSYKYRVVVEADGIYRLTGEMLRDAGISLSELGGAFSTIRLFNRGREIPLFISGEQDGRFDTDDYIEFAGEENRQTYQDVSEGMYRDPYTPQNVYMLTWGGAAGARIVEEDGSIIETDRSKLKIPDTYRYTVHLEEDRLFYRLGAPRSSGLRDHWYWDQILSGPSQGGKKIYDVDLPLPDKYDQDVRYRVMLQGYGEVSRHEASVWFNDAKVGNIAWDGQTGVLLSDSISGSILKETGNRLEIACETPSDRDAILFNWIEINYQRQFRAVKNAIWFSKPDSWQNGLYEFTLSGFTSPDIVVYKDDKSRIRFGEVTPQVTGGVMYYTLRFQDEIFSSQTQYLAINRDGVLKPVAIEPFTDGQLLSVTDGADYLVITHSTLKDKAEELAAYRAGQGYKTMTVTVEDIYNEFDYGIMSPVAVKNFLSYAWHTWQTPPEFVLLAGDGAWDYDRYYNKGANLVPVYLEYTETWGVTASDNWYACVEGGDYVPDMHIGRIPARTPVELGRVIDKIKNYEGQADFSSWRRDLLMIAGIGNPAKDHEPDNLYRMQAENIIQSNLPAGCDVSRVYVWEDTSLAADPYYGGTEELLEQFAEGTVVTTFIGHGGGAVWSDRGLFTLDNVGQMDNAGRLPFILSATCFTSAFDDPRYACLGEAMLMEKDDGCIGFWGASGLGYTYEDIKYFGHVYRSMFDQGNREMGTVITAAKKTYYDGLSTALKDSTGAGWALINQYNLLGDPAVRLNLPDYFITPELSSLSARAGDSLQVTAALPAAMAGSLEVRIVSADHTVDTVYRTVHTGAAVSVQVRLPGNLAAGEYTAAVYIADPAQEKSAVGQTEFSVGETFFSNIRITPAAVSWQDSVSGACRVSSPDSVTAVELLWRREADSVFTRISMSDSADGWYTAASAIPPDSSDSVSYYYFATVNGAGQRDSTGQYKYKVALKPDLAVTDDGLYVTGFDTIMVHAVVKNVYDRPPQYATRSTPMPAESVRVVFSLNGTAMDTALVPELVFERPETVSVPVTLANGNHRIGVAVDPAGLIQEDLGDRNNNTASLDYAVNLFPVAAGSALAAVTADGQFGFSVPVGGSGGSGVLRIDFAESPEMNDQPGFTYVRTAGNRDAVYRVSGSNGLALGGTVIVSHKIDSTRYGIDTVGLFRWDGVTENWVRIPNQYWQAADRIAVACSVTGDFALMVYKDSLDPSIEVNVEDQRYGDGSYVSESPVIVALLQDANGIDTGSGVEVYFDGALVSAADVSVPHGTNVNVVPVTFQPGDMDYGRHTVRFKASDCAGRTMSTGELAMVYAEDLAIKYVGTYPSPFVRETEFAFLVTQTADVTIKIYSSSGRLVRKIDNFYGVDITGLYQQTWDGTDENGNQVANGVYYYKITASNSSSTVTYKGKVARYR